MPHCTRITCQAPKNISQGSVQYTDTVYQASLEYMCQDGFNLIGQRTRSCLHTGNRAGHYYLPIFLIFVHYAQPLTHGSFFNMRFLAILLTLEGYGYEDCPTSGYLLGEWSGEEPRCIATYCPIFQMAQGWVKLEGRQPGDRAMVGCNPGFQISGVSLVVCHVRQELIHMYFCYSKPR